MSTTPPRPPSPRPSPTGVLMRVDLGPGFEHRVYLGPSGTVGDGGVFVATKGLVAVGAVLDISLVIPDGNPPVTLRAVVRWHHRGRQPIGMGARFVLLSDDGRRRIEGHVERFGAMSAPV